MKKFILSVFLSSPVFTHAQIICIFCYDQNDSISQNVNNLLLNGGFENTTCPPLSGATNSYCPNSFYYSCDIANWTCTGGGTSTYACLLDTNYSTVVEGSLVVYFGNSFCEVCSPQNNDTSCIGDSLCTSIGIPAGYPSNDAIYGGNTGVTIEQTVAGLSIGSTYVLEFWTGGEWPNSYMNSGLFAVDVGFGNTYLRNRPSYAGSISRRFIVEFMATSSSHTIRFTSWGHICSTCTELILDDIRLYTLAELSPVVPACNVLSASFNAPNSFCPGSCISFINYSSNASSYQWSFPGAVPDTSTAVNPSGICYSLPGDYDVQLIATNVNGSDTLLITGYISVFPQPAPQSITQNGDTLFAITGATTYQWYFNGNSIGGATGYYFVALASGDYNVVAIDSNGCEVEAAIFNVLAGVDPTVESSLPTAIGMEIFPNPVDNKLAIRNLKIAVGFTISVYNSVGIKVSSAVDCQVPTADCQLLSPGIYFIEVSSGEKIFRSRFVKQ